MLPNFTCEACQVRQVLGRELARKCRDIHLLKSERVHILDTIHVWVESALSECWGQHKWMRCFKCLHKVSTLRPTPMKGPPFAPAIPLVWAQLDCSFWPGKEPGTTTSFGTCRKICSSVSFFHQMDLQAAFPGQVMRNLQCRSQVVPRASPMDEPSLTLQMGGMAR